MVTREDLKEVHYGTPIRSVVLKMEVRKELFRVNSFGYGLDELERYGVASRIARNFIKAPVWHYTNKGNLVCGDGKNTDKLPVEEFTIIIDDNLDFLTKSMCHCGSDRLAVHKLFGVGVTIAGLKPGELGGRGTPFNVTLGDPRK